MRRQKLGKVLGNAYWSHPRSSAAVRDAKRLVQIQMTNVGAVIARATKTDLRIQICAVHVNLAAMCVNDVTNFANGWFEYAVC